MTLNRCFHFAELNRDEFAHNTQCDSHDALITLAVALPPTLRLHTLSVSTRVLLRCQLCTKTRSAPIVESPTMIVGTDGAGKAVTLQEIVDASTRPKQLEENAFCPSCAATSPRFVYEIGRAHV